MNKSKLTKIIIISTIVALLLLLIAVLSIYLIINENDNTNISNQTLSVNQSSLSEGNKSINTPLSQSSQSQINQSERVRENPLSRDALPEDIESVIDNSENLDGDNDEDIFNVIRSTTLYNENDLNVYTTSNSPLDSLGWVKNLGILETLLFKDSQTYMEFRDQTYYIGPGVDYINRTNQNLWILAVQTELNEYTLFECDFGCNTYEIVIFDPARKNVNVEYSQNIDEIKIFSIADNDRFAVPRENNVLLSELLRV